MRSLAPQSWHHRLALVALFGIAALGIVACRRNTQTATSRRGSGAGRLTDPQRVHYAWNDREWKRAGRESDTASSNIEPRDYAGPDSCRKCHEENYTGWSHHPHRWMNAEATPENMRGDFSGTHMSYLGGTATFYGKDRRFYMRLERDSRVRVFEIDRTIGSRFFQYYVGHLIEGEEPPDHPQRLRQNVLPLGYWIDGAEWVPIVHVDLERPDGKRDDPFGERMPFYDYDQACAACHTTLPAGNWMVWRTGVDRLRWYAPHELAFFARDYLDENGGTFWKQVNQKPETAISHIDDLIVERDYDFAGRAHAVTLGISCEACHYGCKEHVENPKQLPLFFPAGKRVRVASSDDREVWGRTPANLNWTCARCHSGNRPIYSSGAHTWNSTEYADALGGGNCYDAKRGRESGLGMLTCTQCHNPHQPIGASWTRTPHDDDRACLKCHEQFQAASAREEHTHHAIGSDGSRCLNCHMPRINEGLQDMVRSHRISSPTERNMLENNQPNACNICHLDHTIDWTIETLSQWYGKQAADVSQRQIDRHYADRKTPVGVGWLASDHFPTRLVAVDSYVRRRDWSELDRLMQALDDPYLINRQFAQRSFEQALGIDLRDVGYRFYHTPLERAELLPQVRKLIRKRVSEQTGAKLRAPETD